MFGHLLNIEVHRKILNPNSDQERDYFGAIPLNVGAMSLISGHGPDFEGVVKYYHPQKQSVSYSRYNFDFTRVEAHPPQNWMIQNEIWRVHSSNEGGYGMGNFPFLDYKTTGYPRPAKDDQIVFEKIGSLSVPGGLGKSVFQKILNATKKNSKKS